MPLLLVYTSHANKISLDSFVFLFIAIPAYACWDKFGMGAASIAMQCLTKAKDIIFEDK